MTHHTMSSPVAEPVDVLVIGAGSAGVAAAVAAAEEGASTLLADAAGGIGGTLAGQLLEHSAGFHNVLGRQLVAGFGQRLVDRMRQLGVSPGHIRDDVGYTATRTPLNHTELMLVEAEFLQNAGVRLWLNAPLVNIERDSGRAGTGWFETRNGRRAVSAGIIIDTSGDAVAAQLAGAQFQTDAQADLQPQSVTFKLAGVDFSPLLNYARAHPDQFRAGSVFGDATDEYVNLWGFGALLQQGYRSGQLTLERNEMHLAGWPRRGEMIVNVTRHAADTRRDDWTGEAWLTLCRQILSFARWFRQSVPGCTRAYVAAVANQIGVRETRRVLGRYTLTERDVLANSRFADVIGQGAFPIDIHSSSQPGLSHTEQVNEGFDIPFGCLVPVGLDHMLAAGRCVSSSHEANGSVRITATCFATGEAAGVAAALAVAQGTTAAGVPVGMLQDRLRRRGAILGREMSPVSSVNISPSQA